MNWTAQAEDLAGALPQLGTRVSEARAAAWRARVDPEATEGLTGASVALGASRLITSVRPMGTDWEMLSRTADYEAEAGELLAAARKLYDQVQAALEAAQDAAVAAAAMEASTDGMEREAATRARREAEREAADCENALETLDEAGPRLDYALACLQRVPDDLAVTYEAPYDLVRNGGKLPYDGDFLTGAAAS